ncbi:thioesterase [Thalassobaculum fulvum]|uniref:Thioesterase n=1 Tax=Thalassobaculum fulvum TaxID=1633335 RepID=A0A918XTH0_9PROT|nr:alpha/beta fold hydrolase [Thalassobaculum fulvum]GHD52914.1 thioesterase [Thalassobaculum fulvum]
MPMDGLGPQSQWFARVRPRPQAAVRLFCFPHAGGAASSYFHWPAALDGVDVLAVQPPGREGRIAEPPVADMATLLERLVAAVEPYLDRRFAFFGHSMGALVAFELARELRRRGLPAPERLYVSGRRSPTVPTAEAPLHVLPDDELVAELNRRFGGLPAAILAEPELMALFLPVIRADLTVLERHGFATEPPLAVPITAFGGVDDARATADGLEAWEELTTGGFAMRRFPGGHFYLHERREAFLRAFADMVAADLGTGRAPGGAGS